MIETSGTATCDASCSCRRSSTSRTPTRVLEHFTGMLAARRRRLRLDAERAHARARRAPSAPATRGTCASTAPRSSARCAQRHFGSVELLGLFHARKLRAHELAIEHAGWDASTPRCGSPSRSTTASRRRSRRATSRCAPSAASTARWTSSRCCARERRPRSRIVLHTHMPYVEGFGTWPFGEEWLWEAMATSYLPLLDVLDAGARARDAVAHAGAVRPARGARRRSSASAPSCARCGAESHRARRRGGRRPRGGGASSSARRARTRARPQRLERAATCSARSRRTWPGRRAATHAVLPLLATDAGVRLQLRDRIAAHRARFGALGRRLLAARVRARAVARPAARGGRRARDAAST